MEIFFWLLVLASSLFVLIVASRYFTESAERLGYILGIPSFLIGITIVAVGTSLPELISSIVAVVGGSTEFVVGNVIGSNVTNIFLIFGVTAILAGRISITRELLAVDMTFLIGSTFLLVAAVLDGEFTFSEALIFITGFIAYTVYALNIEKEGRYGRMIVPADAPKTLEKVFILTLILAPVFIFAGAFYAVESVIKLSIIFNVGAEIIAASAIALGTSLPELAVSISAVTRGKAEMAVGNILGSNIFNTFAVMGIPALFMNLQIPNTMITFGLPILLMATFLYFFAVRDNKTTKWEGWMLIIFYVFYISSLFASGTSINGL